MFTFKANPTHIRKIIQHSWCPGLTVLNKASYNTQAIRIQQYAFDRVHKVYGRFR